MDTARKFVMYGPGDTLKRLPEQFNSDTKPQYTYHHESGNGTDEVFVNIYEEHRKLTNSSTTVVVILTLRRESLGINFIVTGGRMGFRGSSMSNDTAEPLIKDTVYDYLIDFSKRHGLTIQEAKIAEDSEKDG